MHKGIFGRKCTIENETMTTNRRVDQMKAVQTEALELATRKNEDYGDAFAEYGVIGVLMRIEDKLKRSMSITKNGVNLDKDEGIRDTLIDLHNCEVFRTRRGRNTRINRRG